MFTSAVASKIGNGSTYVKKSSAKGVEKQLCSFSYDSILKGDRQNKVGINLVYY